jgi:hypothetical protein
MTQQDAPSDGDKHPVCFSGFHLAADELGVRQNNQMHKIILLLLHCIGISSCGTIPSDFRPVWIHPGIPPDQPQEHLPAPSGFGITTSQAYRTAWNSRRLSLKHQWSLYADSNYYYVHDTFLGDSTNRAFRQGLRINGRSGANELRAEQDAASNGGQRPSLNSGFLPRRG